MKWSSPIPLSTSHVHTLGNVPAVYRLVAIKPDGESLPVARVFGSDPVGRILIGETTELARRFNQVVRSATTGRSGHGPGITYHEWIGYHQYVPENVRFQFADLAPVTTSLRGAFGELADEDTVTKLAELQLIFAYRHRFGDAPPANSQAPHYNDVEAWIKELTGNTPTYSKSTGMIIAPGFDFEAPFHDLVD
ncbi:MAG: hypothetical protein JNM72_25140 [Deltaproteobacteria bacterium]|nr:hypothetical protein [Deltaproteobacteria bacterium]